MWPFLLTWICSDLSFGLWQLMDDWWCCFSSVIGEARHLGESTSLTHSDLALTCVGQQKSTTACACHYSLAWLVSKKWGFFFISNIKQSETIGVLHFQILFILCSLVWLYCFKMLLVAIRLTNRHLAVSERHWVKKCLGVVFTKNCHQWKINYLRVHKG